MVTNVTSGLGMKPCSDLLVWFPDSLPYPLGRIENKPSKLSATTHGVQEMLQLCRNTEIHKDLLYKLGYSDITIVRWFPGLLCCVLQVGRLHNIGNVQWIASTSTGTSGLPLTAATHNHHQTFVQPCIVWWGEGLKLKSQSYGLNSVVSQSKYS